MTRKRNSKVRVESWDDVRDAFDDLLKRPISRFEWHRGILDRYKNGDLTIHIHILGCIFGRTLSACITAKANRDATGLEVLGTKMQQSDVDFRLNRVVFADDNFVDGIVANEINSPAIRMNSEFMDRCLGDDLDQCGFGISDGQQWKTMLVFVSESLQNSERFIPSTVRLNFFDNVNNRCGKVITHQVRKTIVVETCGGIGEREIKPVSADNRGWSGIFDSELPSNVIKTGSDVGETITEDTAQEQWWAGFYHSMLHGDLISIVLGGEFVRMALKVSRHFKFERIQVLLSPDDFEP